MFSANASIKNVTWTSNSEAASVSGGVVTGQSPGSATITCSTVDGNFEAYCYVTVDPELEYVTSVTLQNPTPIYMQRNRQIELTANVFPSNTLQEVEWTVIGSPNITINKTGNLTCLVIMGNDLDDATIRVSSVCRFEK